MTTLAAGLHSLAMFQAPDAIDSGNAKLLMIFIGIAAFALLAQAIVMIVLAAGAAKAQKTVMADIAEIKAKVLPFIHNSHGLVTDLTPQLKQITAKTHALVTDLTPHVKDITVKVQTLVTDLSPEITGITKKVHSITGNVEEISVMAKDKALAFGPTIEAANETAKQANESVRATILDAGEKTREQVSRVNSMITQALDTTAKITKAIEHGVTQPAREVSGFVTGTKVAVEHLVKHYGGAVSLSSLASLVGFGKKKTAPSPYTPQKPAATTHVAPNSPESMGTSTLPSAFGSTRRDLDL